MSFLQFAMQGKWTVILIEIKIAKLAYFDGKGQIVIKQLSESRNFPGVPGLRFFGPGSLGLSQSREIGITSEKGDRGGE